MPENPDHDGLIELKLQTLHQLFNSMDPSPFHERDLDADAEEFIVSWAQEHPLHAPFKLFVHLAQPPDSGDPTDLIRESVHHYFGYKADVNRREFRRLMRDGWISLLIGFTFLAACMIAARSITSQGEWPSVIREGLTIIGWVAMWRPLETYLYLWWPLRRLGTVYRKLSEMPVEVNLAK